MDYKLQYLKYKLKYLTKKTDINYGIYKNKQIVKILKIHYDDIDPYYTILVNNKERQTTKKNLKLK
jgi:hypothetical protein